LTEVGPQFLNLEAYTHAVDDETFKAWLRDWTTFLDCISAQPRPGRAIADGVWLYDLPPRVQELTARGDADGLLALLEESEGRVSYKAGECLAGVLGDRRAVEPLLRHLRAFDLSSPSEEEIGDWKTVAFALVCVEPPGSPAADELLRTLEERDFRGVVYAGHLLAAIGDRRAIDPLLRRLRAADPSDCSEESRAEWYWLTQALGRLRAVEAVDTLIAALPFNVWLMQEDTVRALERIDDPRAIPALVAGLYPPMLGHFDVAQNAMLNALDHFGTPEAIEVLELYDEAHAAFETRSRASSREARGEWARRKPNRRSHKRAPE
jgi:HEAT repeat protein